MRGFLAVAAAVTGVVLGVATAAAIPVYGTSAAGELIGSRDVSAGGGLAGSNDWDNDVFKVEWEITIGTVVHYKYTFTGLTRKDVSHFALDLSDDCISGKSLADPDCVTNAILNGGGVTLEFGDSDGITGSVKFDDGGGEGIVYEFDSNRLPVYGHLAVKDGGGRGSCAAPGGPNLVCSNQLVGLGDPMNPNDFVARPNGVVPEPATVALLGLGLLGLATTRRR